MNVLEPRGTIRLQERNCKRGECCVNDPPHGLYSGDMVGSTKTRYLGSDEVRFREGGHGRGRRSTAI